MSAVVVLSPEQLAALVREAVAAELDARGLKPASGWLPISKTGLPSAAVKKLVKSGVVRGCVVGRETCVSAEDLEKYMNARTDQPRSVIPNVIQADAFENARLRARARRSA